jgi:hypothetical protein
MGKDNDLQVAMQKVIEASSLDGLLIALLL